MVKILVFGLTLRNAVGQNEIELQPVGLTSVKQIIESHLNELGALVPFMMNREVLITINKKVSTEDSIVKDGDTVKLSFQSRASYDGTRDIPT